MCTLTALLLTKKNKRAYLLGVPGIVLLSLLRLLLQPRSQNQVQDSVMSWTALCRKNSLAQFYRNLSKKWLRGTACRNVCEATHTHIPDTGNTLKPLLKLATVTTYRFQPNACQIPHKYRRKSVQNMSSIQQPAPMFLIVCSPPVHKALICGSEGWFLTCLVD